MCSTSRGSRRLGPTRRSLVVTDVSERERRRRAEREFVDNAAHELRTPLAAITSAIERLQAGARDVPEKRDRFLGHIQHESARLNRLASSLLVLARAQTREEEPRREEIALRELLEELVGGLELSPEVELVARLPARPRRAQQPRPARARAAQPRRATPRTIPMRGRIRVSARVEDDGSVTIEVADTGAGIAPEELEQALRPLLPRPGRGRPLRLRARSADHQGGRRGARRQGRDRVGSRRRERPPGSCSPAPPARLRHERAHPRRRRHGGDPRRGHRRSRGGRVRGAGRRPTARRRSRPPRRSRSTS